ncbi:hypothetical protein ACJMK2_041467 [Sinanodonta woodiana]|uniref:TRIM56 n=1 Tax=Sinanodonta woodiana TaxID=1069815 RepID=A0ABD3W812_SINWO
MATRLVCGICCGSYKKPKILSCFHSFCEACIDSLIIAKTKPDLKFQCPLCSMDIDIPEGKARSLQNNVYVKTVEEKKVADEKLTVSCENCDDEKKREAIKYCTACQQNICDNCVLLHGKLKTTKSHELVDVENPKSRTRLCKKHYKEVGGSFCQNCEDFVCATCRDEDHKLHFTEDTGIASTKRTRNIEKTLLESEIYLGLVQHRLEGMTQNLKSLVTTHEKNAMDELEKTANAWKENIDSALKASSLKVKQLSKKELTELDVIEKSMISAIENRELINKWLLHASNEELLAEGVRIQRKILEVNFSLPSYIPPLNVVTLVKARNAIPSLSAYMIGVVSTKKIPNANSISLELVSSFCLPSNNQILFILPYKDTQVWIAQQNINGLVMYKEDGTRKDQMLMNNKIIAVGMDCDLNLLACVYQERKIIKMSGDRKVSDFCTLKNIPELIAVCPDGRVVVCERNARQLIIVNNNGRETPWSQQGTNVFNSVQCIAVCKYTNILAVVDSENTMFYSAPVHVYLFDHRGDTVNKFENCKVYCIVSDNRGHFLLGCNNEIMVIDVRGNKLANISCRQHSFEALSMAVDTVNQLWIGGKGQISIFKYLDVSIYAAKT